MHLYCQFGSALFSTGLCSFVPRGGCSMGRRQGCILFFAGCFIPVPPSHAEFPATHSPTQLSCVGGKRLSFEHHPCSLILLSYLPFLPFSPQLCRRGTRYYFCKRFAGLRSTY